jgi:hypothetical protein
MHASKGAIYILRTCYFYAPNIVGTSLCIIATACDWCLEILTISCYSSAEVCSSKKSMFGMSVQKRFGSVTRGFGEAVALLGYILIYI